MKQKKAKEKPKARKKRKKKLLKNTGQKNISKPGMTTSVTLNTTLLQNKTNLHVMKRSGFRIATSASSQSGERAGASTITPTLVLGGQRQVLHVQGRSHNIHCSTFNFYRSDDLLRTTPSPAPAPKGNRLC